HIPTAACRGEGKAEALQPPYVETSSQSPPKTMKARKGKTILFARSKLISAALGKGQVMEADGFPAN
ncbi:MAG: hypothetical protein HY912_10325, partial [Desulfomonile tiedjei]|nr:hypothetical protein [Desulfomonile tiedjei]